MMSRRPLLLVLMLATLVGATACHQTPPVDVKQPVLFDPSATFEQRIEQTAADPEREESLILRGTDRNKLLAGEVPGITSLEGQCIGNQLFEFERINQVPGDYQSVYWIDAEAGRAEITIFKEDNSLESLVLSRFPGVSGTALWLPTADSVSERTNRPLLSTLVNQAKRDSSVRATAGMLCGSCNSRVLTEGSVTGISAEEGESIHAQFVAYKTDHYAAEDDYMPIIWLDGEAGRAELTIFRADGEIVSCVLIRQFDKDGKASWSPEE